MEQEFIRNQMSVAVKVPVFSTEKLSSVEVSLGPEMRSTGEVLGVGNNVDEAIYKGLLGAKRVHIIKDRKILVTIRDKDKEEFLPIAKSLVEHGSILYATKGTQKFLAENGVEATVVNKIDEPSPNISDILKTEK